MSARDRSCGMSAREQLAGKRRRSVVVQLREMLTCCSLSSVVHRVLVRT